MASRVKQAAVDALPAQLQAVFRTLRSEQWTTNMEALMQLKDVGKNVTLAQVDHWAEELRSRGFINTDETHGRLRYKRAEIIPESKDHRPIDFGKGQSQQSAPPVVAAERALLDMVVTARGYASEIESQCAGLSRALDLVIQYAEEIATRPTPAPLVTPEELAVLRTKAGNWDDLQTLMGRK